jgi:hypothetical protein
LDKVTQRKQRGFDDLESVNEIFDILQTKFVGRKLYIRYTVDKTEIIINEFLDDKTLILGTEPTFKPEKTFSIYGLSDKYVEVDLEVLEEKGPGYFHCKITSGRRAIQGRRDIRFKVSSEEVVATNFKISKHTIDVSNLKIPTSIKVVLDQFQTSNSRLGDILKVDVFSSDEKNQILMHIKKSCKTLFIQDASDEGSYVPMTEDFVDLQDVLGNDLNKFIKVNTQKGYKSIIIVPIIYITEDEKSIPFAYIQLISKTENFELGKVVDLKEESFKLVDRIRDANTVFLPVHQNVLDISRGGAKLEITDPDLKKSILKSRGFIFDIVFKLQAPITIYGDIKATQKVESDLHVGVDFEGNSSRKDEMKRFYSIIQPMEADYKARLIKSLKSKGR